MLGNHLLGIHSVHVIGTEHNHIVGLLIIDQVEGLQERIGGTQIPVLAQTLLGRRRGNILRGRPGELPCLRNMPVEGVGFILREHTNLEVAGIDQVG